MNNGATGTTNFISGKMEVTPVVPVGTGETIILDDANGPRIMTFQFANIGASSSNLTVYLKPSTRPATAAVDDLAIVKTFAVAADNLLTLTIGVPSLYVVTALASAATINAQAWGTQEL